MPLSPEDKDAVMKEYRSESKRNAARKAFSSACARIEQLAANGADIFELRAAEFESVDAILAAYHPGDPEIGDPDNGGVPADGDAVLDPGVGDASGPDAELARPAGDAGGAA